MGRSVPKVCLSRPTRLSRRCSVDLSHTPPAVISQNHNVAPTVDVQGKSGLLGGRLTGPASSPPIRWRSLLTGRQIMTVTGWSSGTMSPGGSKPRRCGRRDSRSLYPTTPLMRVRHRWSECSLSRRQVSPRSSSTARIQRRLSEAKAGKMNTDRKCFCLSARTGQLYRKRAKILS